MMKKKKSVSNGSGSGGSSVELRRSKSRSPSPPASPPSSSSSPSPPESPLSSATTTAAQDTLSSSSSPPRRAHSFAATNSTSSSHGPFNNLNNGNNGSSSLANSAHLVFQWKTAFLFWCMSLVGVLRVYQHADPISLMQLLHNMQHESVDISQKAQAHFVHQTIATSQKTPFLQVHNVNGLVLPNKSARHLEDDSGANNAAASAIRAPGQVDPSQQAAILAARQQAIRASGHSFQDVAERLKAREEYERKQEEELARRNAPPQVVVEPPPPLAPEQEEEEEEDSVAALETSPPTVAPTSSSLYRNQFDVVHVIHTPFYVSPAMGKVRLELLKRVTLPSLQHQTSREFLYLVWVDRSQLSVELLVELQLALEEYGDSGDGSVLQNQVLLLNAKRSDMMNIVQHDLRSTWFATQVSRNVKGTVLLGSARRLLDYSLAAQSRIYLDTLLEPGDALLKDFAITLHKEAATSLATATTNNNNAKATAIVDNYQVWCSNVYLEWRVDNPWKKKTKSKRGLIQGVVNLQNRFQQQCDFETGLTVGYTAGYSSNPIHYSVQTGIAAADAPSREWRDYVLQFQNVLWSGSGGSSGGGVHRRPPGHLPLCDVHGPKKCLRYHNVGLYEYGVVRVLTVASDDVSHVVLHAGRNDAHDTNGVDEGWRTLQDKTFALLPGRFGIDPKRLFGMKRVLQVHKYNVLKEQHVRHEQACGSSDDAGGVSGDADNNNGVGGGDASGMGLNQFLRQQRRLDAMGGAPLESCILESKAVVETFLTDLEERMELEQEKRQQQEQEQQQGGSGYNTQQERDDVLGGSLINTGVDQEDVANNNALVNSFRNQEQQQQQQMEQWQRSQVISAALNGTLTAAARQQQQNQQQQIVSLQQQQQQVALPGAGGMTVPMVRPQAKLWTQWKNTRGLVHVVHSRFMQHQAQLMNLGKARIDLFRTFTLPSMRFQTTQEYMWMIWTDPDLNKDLLAQLIAEIQDFPNIVVVGNMNLVNTDFRQSINGLGAEPDPASILYGSRELLLDYYQASQSRILLETRLDADDALSKDFLETVQHEAVTSISRDDKTDFRVWCANRYVDWRYYSPTEQRNGIKTGSGKGYLAPEQDLKGCVTVGLTMGFQTKAGVDQLPTKEHHRIRETLTSCKKTNKRCVRGLVTPDKQFFALRARTPTSTSMVNVVVSEDGSAVELAQQQMWQGIQRDFDIGADQVWGLRDRFQEHLPDILLDAIAGLCKAGHSCRQSSKNTLMKLLKEAVANANQVEQERKAAAAAAAAMVVVGQSSSSSSPLSPDQNARTLLNLLKETVNEKEEPEPARQEFQQILPKKNEQLRRDNEAENAVLRSRLRVALQETKPESSQDALSLQQQQQQYGDPAVVPAAGGSNVAPLVGAGGNVLAPHAPALEPTAVANAIDSSVNNNNKKAAEASDTNNIASEPESDSVESLLQKLQSAIHKREQEQQQQQQQQPSSDAKQQKPRSESTTAVSGAANKDGTGNTELPPPKQQRMAEMAPPPPAPKQPDTADDNKAPPASFSNSNVVADHSDLLQKLQVAIDKDDEDNSDNHKGDKRENDEKETLPAADDADPNDLLQKLQAAIDKHDDDNKKEVAKEEEEEERPAAQKKEKHQELEPVDRHQQQQPPAPTAEIQMQRQQPEVLPSLGAASSKNLVIQKLQDAIKVIEEQGEGDDDDDDKKGMTAHAADMREETTRQKAQTSTGPEQIVGSDSLQSPADRTAIIQKLRGAMKQQHGGDAAMRVLAQDEKDQQQHSGLRPVNPATKEGSTQNDREAANSKKPIKIAQPHDNPPDKRVADSNNADKLTPSNNKTKPTDQDRVVVADKKPVVTKPVTAKKETVKPTSTKKPNKKPIAGLALAQERKN